MSSSELLQNLSNPSERERSWVVCPLQDPLLAEATRTHSVGLGMTSELSWGGKAVPTVLDFFNKLLYIKNYGYCTL